MKPHPQPDAPRASVCLYRRAAALGVCFSVALSLSAGAGDLLRGGASAAQARKSSGSGQAPGVNPAAELARANGRDALARTTAAVQAVKAMQAKARDLAIKGPSNLGVGLPNVPDGLGVGGLKVATGVPVNLSKPNASEDAALWKGAALPTQTVTGDRTKVVIKQSEQQAVLNWETFNIGKKTTLQFDQSAGKSDQSKWTAFNKVNDPSGKPSQILGAIEAPGHVYVINRNGIIFGGSSQVNTRAFVASTLPINDNLIKQGLLNNKDAQFLFSALPVPGGSDGTPAFNPTISDPGFGLTVAEPTYTLLENVALTNSNTPVGSPVFSFLATDGSRTKLGAGTDYTLAVNATTKRATATFTAAGLAKVGAASVSVAYTPAVVKTGDVVVQAGARLNGPVSSDGNGGRVMLVGSNVRNEGTISTPSGQTIIAAGQQVGVAAHASDDPSLRGLDVWVGAVGDGGGTATNTGIIESFTGSVSMSGRQVNQLGVIDSSTSVTLNGRIDLNASYGAVGHPNFDAAGGNGIPFFFQQSGVVKLGIDSVTRILPDYASEKTVPGTTLPEQSQINIDGLAIHLGARATMLAPNADVRFSAGTWPYKDANGDRTTLGIDGLIEAGFTTQFSGTKQRFLFDKGQIYVDSSAMINVAGTPDVFVPLAQSILDVEFRGSELADSPVQRGGLLRAVPLTIDLRKTGENNGQYWMGTPLGDAIGLAGLIQRNVAQLTARGGNVTLHAGGSIVVQEGASIDVSGGYFTHEGGMVETTRLLQAGRLVPIENALPGQVYQGVYTGKFSVDHGKWGVTETFSTPFASGAHFEASYIEGAAGGSLTLTAPSMAVDGKLRGITIAGPHQRAERPELSHLSLSFTAEQRFAGGGSDLLVNTISPTPPAVVFGSGSPGPAVGEFTMVGDVPAALSAARLGQVVLSPELLEEEGFGHLSVENPDGTVTVPTSVKLTAAPGGSIALRGSNITIGGDLAAPGGSLSLRAANLSLEFLANFRKERPDELLPAPNPNRGLVSIAPGAVLNTAGLFVDDRVGVPAALSAPLVLDGGKISIESFSANVAVGSTLDVSGGARISERGRVTYGNGGSINLVTGRDLGLPALIGGQLALGGTLRGYGGASGGSLTLRSQIVRIGGTSAFPRALVLQPDFFQQGGFTRYSINGIGAPTGPLIETGPSGYVPAISIASGTIIEPAAERWQAQASGFGDGSFSLNPVLLPVGERTPTSVSFTGVGADDSVTPNKLEARADLVISQGAQILTDPGASIALSGDTVTVRGTLSAPGGAISIRGRDIFPLASNLGNPTPLPTVHLAKSAHLSAAGTTVLLPDAFGRRTGTVLDGGMITVYGSIVAESGAVLDVSGTTGVLDYHPSLLGAVTSPTVPAQSGLTAPLWRVETQPVRLESDGGLIELEGSQMLFSDATLRGLAGGASGIGGTLSIHSGRFYPRTNEGVITGGYRSSDINLVVTQDGNVVPKSGALGVGKVVRGAGGVALPAMGYFAIDRFSQGGFYSLELGAKLVPSPATSLVPSGGNIRFDGPVSINAPGPLRLAAGGIIEANSRVQLAGSYVSVGQPFRVPLNPGVRAPDAFQSFTTSAAPLALPPTSGSGRLTIQAGLIDLGNLSLQNIGTALFDATSDIRGNGTVSIRGDLTLRADQIYPTTLSTLNLFAYDPADGHGSITFLGRGGAPAIPLSVGGNLRAFAHTIRQEGTLRAPLGTITLGWDGLTDFDTADADIDSPFDPLARGSLPVPVAAEVSLAKGSITSVSAVDGVSGSLALFPFGLSPDGFSWIDPRGVNVTAAGLPEKSVTLAGQSVKTAAGSTIDLRGGGDLSAFRWVPGVGGSIDRLGTASTEWISGTSYDAGDLVLFNGNTYSARVSSRGEQPKVGLFWSRVAESFAVLPKFGAAFAPENSFATGASAGLLQGNPGYIFTPNSRADRVFTSLAATTRASGGFHIGDQIHLDATPSLEAGLYTLLPRRYALLPGALLVTAQAGDPFGTFTTPEGATFTSGYRLNAFQAPGEVAGLRTRFEVAPQAVLRGRSAYDEFHGNAFFTEASRRLEIERPQRLPNDAGYLAFSGNTALKLEGGVLTGRPSGALGAAIDISSSADIFLLGGRGAAPDGAKVVLKTGVLQSWGAESLLIGGLRREEADGTAVTVRTSKIVLDNPGATFTGSDITLVSKAGLTLTDGSAIQARGRLAGGADTFQISGDGAALRVSAGGAAIERSNVNPAATTPLLTLGAGAKVAGRSMLLDSTYGTLIEPSALVSAGSLTLGSGQISILLEPQAGPLAGEVVSSQLILDGQFLAAVQQVSSLTLRSYRTIDLYGSGTFGSGSLQQLELLAGGLRGYASGAEATVIQAGEVLFSNPANVAALPAPAAAAGSLQVAAGTLRLGVNAFGVTGYDQLALNAAGGVLGEGTGSFTTGGDLTITAPRITGARSANQAITATGDLVLAKGAGTPKVLGDLGARFAFTGASVLANADLQLQSGQLTLRAVTGDVTVGGSIDVSGTTRQFYDPTRYSNAGRVILTSDRGDVELAAGSQISVAAAGTGEAGTFAVSAVQGTLRNLGSTLLGEASADARSGSFLLDVKSIGAYATVNDPLQTGGFFNERDLRVRSGSVTIDGTSRAREFTLSADAGAITVSGTIDASGTTPVAGRTGGKITLVAGGGLSVTSGARLTAHASNFDAAGKGGAIRLEAGAAINGVANPAARLNLQAGSTIDLGVDDFGAGGVTNIRSSAFRGHFTGTLHLRAPRIGNEVAVGALAGSIVGASSILVEGFRVYDQTASGLLDNALLQTIDSDATAYLNAGYSAMETRLLGANAGLSNALVIAPGIEIVSRTGGLVLGSDAEDYQNDWDLSGMRYGPKNAPGVLTLRAAGNLEFKNALSDGFAGDFSPNDFLETPPVGQQLWLRPLMDIAATLPVNTQSWSFRLAAGADVQAADYQRLRPLDTLGATEGSILVGKFLPTNLVSGSDATTGSAIENRLSFVRTGAGDISLAAGRDVQLRNQFASIYTAGVRLPYSGRIYVNPGSDPDNPMPSENDVRLMKIYADNDFAVPIVELYATTSHPGQGLLGTAQQAYAAQYSMAGGNVSISAQADIARFGLNNFGQVAVDSSRQLPNNWLYRRGYVDPVTGLFGDSGPGGSGDRSASTTWWVDFSNFFQGFGALGGGNVALAGRNIINADAVAPTNARMAGRDEVARVNLAPDASRLLELGGGDVTVRAENDIDGGVYYTERGSGILRAGGEIKTNAARAPVTTDRPTADSRTWLPTTLFVGKSTFDVSAGSDILLGPVTNPFLLPQGVNNKFWYKTYFNTFSADAAVNVASFGGNVTHRLVAADPGSLSVAPILRRWLGTQNLLAENNSSFTQPWIRLAETRVDLFDTGITVSAPTLRSTAFAGNVNIAGEMNLFPSAKGTLELAATQGVIGLQSIGVGSRIVDGATRTVNVWASSSLNVSDADPASIAGITSPLGLQAFVARDALQGSSDLPFASIDLAFNESGATQLTVDRQRALHDTGILHAGDPDPVRISALGGDVTGLELFTPKAARIVASNDISDVSLYLQNANASDISLVSAGRDLLLFNENTRLRTTASDLARGNSLAGTESRRTVLATNITSLPGDLQISGPGALEVFAGRTFDLGVGANVENLLEITGLGLTSIGNLRNPFLTDAGADLLVFAGVQGLGDKGPALGLTQSSMDFKAFGDGQAEGLGDFESNYLNKLGLNAKASALTDEQKAIVALEVFYRRLRNAGRDFATTGGYADGELAVETLFASAGSGGEIFTRARDIRTSTGGSISIGVPGGGVTMASDIFGNPLTPPGIVTEAGGGVSVFTEQSVDIGQARIFTLRGGDIVMWSTEGDIAAGNAPKTVVTAPPTRVVIDVTSADVQTDLGGLATGGGIGVLASVEGVMPGDVDLIAPKGVVDAGDAGIRVTGNLNIAATAVLNFANISVGGASSGVPTAPTVSAPNIGGLSAASNAAGASSNTTRELAQQQRPEEKKEEAPSIISVEVLGYGDGSAPEASPAPSAPPPAAPPPDDEEEKKRKAAASTPQAA